MEHVLAHAIEHSVVDTLYLIPFLFVTYLAMEWLEHKTAGRTQEAVQRAGAAGPVVGALLGAVPQCGFSAASATLYAGRVITLGTMFAVFLSTSDEMLPIFLAEQVPASAIAKILGAKIVIGMTMGFAVDAVMRLARRDRQPLRIHELCERDGCACAADCATCEKNPELVYRHHDDAAHHGECAESLCGHDHAHACGCGGHAESCAEDASRAVDFAPNRPCHEFSCGEACCKGHDHDHSHDHGWKGIVKSAFVHTAQVAVFIFVVTLLLNGVLEAVGEEVLADFLGENLTLSVFASALVGLVPNCAASVAIAQLYVEGVLGSGAMMAGLLVSAGVGLLVLLRANRSMRENFAVIVALYATGVFWGLVVNFAGVAF